MARRSNKSIAEVLAQPLPSKTSSKNENQLLERKISVAIEGLGTTRFCELILRDRNRLSKENAWTVSELDCSLIHSIHILPWYFNLKFTSQ
ncbi:MAG: hypothetical protein WA364_11755 [Candidatus Nitrosopolaris sp.]